MHVLLLFVTLGGVLGGLTDPRTQYSAFRDKRLQTSYVVDYKQTSTLCQCVTSCRTSATCYGVAYGPMYATSATLAIGTPGVCHIATQPQVPSGLANYTGYTALIRGRVDSGCDEILGYEKLGAAGCIWLSDVTLDRDSGQAACQARGGILAVLDTTDKYNAVVNRLQAIQPKPGHHWVEATWYLIGGWLWQQKTPVTGSWAPGEPSGVLSFSTIMNSDMNFMLANKGGGDKYNFVCQMPAKW
ncbi:uncharacterized protein LOC108669137 [Hyalella azteca]|uniref:Uncharacterized protein LOC108669137 n=1 Tax=Hyalella azteca TaxID=294128 RepID=A0A8B7NE93_HYAAZ|nr:uncharacterized protein LOC108669137 [Hyalella azteca]XP_047736987.1 uncharacterized protein LOC108669137 [Hyalella azteca]